MENSKKADLFQRFILVPTKITQSLKVADPGVDTNTFRIPHSGRLTTPADKFISQYAALPYEGLWETLAK
jgi:hypothetical protein